MEDRATVTWSQIFKAIQAVGGFEKVIYAMRGKKMTQPEVSGSVLVTAGERKLMAAYVACKATEAAKAAPALAKVEIPVDCNADGLVLIVGRQVDGQIELVGPLGLESAQFSSAIANFAHNHLPTDPSTEFLATMLDLGQMVSSGEQMGKTENDLKMGQSLQSERVLTLVPHQTTGVQFVVSARHTDASVVVRATPKIDITRFGDVVEPVMLIAADVSSLGSLLEDATTRGLISLSRDMTTVNFTTKVQNAALDPLKHSHANVSVEWKSIANMAEKPLDIDGFKPTVCRSYTQADLATWYSDDFAKKHEGAAKKSKCEAAEVRFEGNAVVRQGTYGTYADAGKSSKAPITVKFDLAQIADVLSVLRTKDTGHVMARPLITAADGFLPPIPEARRYLGQRWSQGHNDQTTLMGITRFTLGEAWSVRAGLANSQVMRSRNFTEVFAVATPDGAGRHRVIADPRQFSRSVSGEAQLAWNRDQGRLRHRVLFMVRGRNRLTETGGSDAQDLGPVVLGEFDHDPEKAFRFGPVDKGRIKQLTFGVGYVGALKGVGQVNLGLQKTDYRQSFRHLGGLAETEAKPLLYNAALTLTPRPWLSVYATYVRGLEESGAAPENAANRNEQLNPSRTTQIDGGVRIARGKTRLVVSLFQIEKPYFTYDAKDVFTEQGQVRHRGVEASLSQDIGGLHILAGAVVMDPVVTGAARAAGRVGKRPVTTTPVLVRIDADYKTPIAGLSFSGALVHTAPRTASARTYAALGGGQLKIPATTVVDLGLRYRFKTAEIPMSLRVLVGNVFNDRSWRVLAANTYQAADTRRLSVGLAADF